MNILFTDFNKAAIQEGFKSGLDFANTFFTNLTYHISNSGGIFKDSKNHYDMVRPGITLYGVTPFGKSHEKLNPVMHFKAPVVLKKKIDFDKEDTRDEIFKKYSWKRL